MDIKKIIPQKCGDFYLLPDGSAESMKNLVVLAHSIDTVNQFFVCRLRKSFFTKLETAALPIEYEIKGRRYVLSKMGKSSGYQFSLQSKEIGAQFLFKSFYKDVSVDASHIKLSLSPHFLIRPYENQVEEIDRVVEHLTHFAHPSHFAIHYAIDFQLKDDGVSYVEHVFPDFADRLKGFRAQRCYINQKLEIDTKDLELTINGRRGIETVTIGAQNAFQLTVYRKDLEILKTNKVEHFREIWGSTYDPSFPVFRLELRLHQTQLETYKIFEKHYLDYLKNADFGLFRTFMLQRSRFMDSTKTVLSPVWYELLQSFSTRTIVQRQKFKKDRFKTKANSQMALGNVFSLLFKLGLPPVEAVDQILASDPLRVAAIDAFNLASGFSDDVLSHFSEEDQQILKSHRSQIPQLEPEEEKKHQKARAALFDEFLRNKLLEYASRKHAEFSISQI